MFGAIVPLVSGTALVIFSFVLMASALARSVPVPHRNRIDTKLSAHWSLESWFFAAVISKSASVLEHCVQPSESRSFELFESAK